MLSEERRQELDAIVGEMIRNKETDASIRFVVDDFKQKYTEEAEATPAGKTGLAGFGSGLVKSGLGLAKGLGTIGEKILSPIDRTLGLEPSRLYQNMEIAPARGGAEKFGQFAGDVAQFAIPGAKIGKATKALSFIPKVLTRAAGDAAIQGLRTGGDVGEAGTAGGVSAGVQVATAGAGLGLRVLGGIFKNAAGLVTGRGSDVIEGILKNPQAAKQGLKQPVTQTLKEDIKNIRNQVSELSKASGKNYRGALEEIGKKYETVVDNFKLGKSVAPERNYQGRFNYNAASKPTQKITTIKPQKGTSIIQSQGGEKFNLSVTGLRKQMTSLLRGHDVEVNPRKQELEFLGSTLRKSEENVLREVFSVVNRWKDTSPAGIDRLAVKIGNYVKPGEQSKQLNSILSSLKTGTRNYLGKLVPEAKTMVSRYRQEQKFLSNVKTFLSAGVGPTDDPVALKNMAAKLGSLFTKNKELSREVLESLPGGSDIIGRQAGRELTTPIARSGASIGSLVQSAVQTVVPPKLIGQIAAQSGIASQKLQPFFSALRGLEATERATLLRLLIGAETTDQEN